MGRKIHIPNKNSLKTSAVFDGLAAEKVVAAMKTVQRQAFESWAGRAAADRSIKVVSQEVGVTRQTVTKWMKMFNWERLAAERDNEVYELVEEQVKEKKVNALVHLRDSTFGALKDFWGQIAEEPERLEIKGTADIGRLTNCYLQLVQAVKAEDGPLQSETNQQFNLFAFGESSPQILDQLTGLLRNIVDSDGKAPNPAAVGQIPSDPTQDTSQAPRPAQTLEIGNSTILEKARQVTAELEPERRIKIDQNGKVLGQKDYKSVQFDEKCEDIIEAHITEI